uniref:Uncharacterized protein n=1 Tax=Arundo donax TaxID=35708 RepID=A0A0A8ZDS8_ARUDO
MKRLPICFYFIF